MSTSSKNKILSEIRRVAAAQGGRAPGKNQFFNQTGIKESDWPGRFWRRWSDAVVEAGLEPNILQPRHDDGFLLERLAQVSRELGRFPTMADLKLARRRDQGFPSEQTFSRFGSKATWPERLLAFCESSEQHRDVAAICRGEIERTQVRNAAESETAESEQTDPAYEDGTVYLLKAGRDYKIGRTNSSKRRERELAIQLPEKATKVHEIRTDDAAGIEAYWHRRFADRRKNGEWFALTASDVKAFKRRRFM